MSNGILGGWAWGNAMGNAARPTDALGAELARRERARDEERQSNLEENAKSWMRSSHNMFAKLNARVEAEAELLAQLHDAGVDVPLGNESALSKRATEKYLELFFDKKVIGVTFENRILPKESAWGMDEIQNGTRKVKWCADDYLENK